LVTRKRIDLHRLPQWAQYAIALTVAALVMFLGWRAGRNRPAPGWIGPFVGVWTWIGPALLAFFLVKWLVQRARGRRSRT
jgi:hypothetical protein